VKGKKQTRGKSAARRSPSTSAACELCAQAGGDVLWSDKQCRVVLIEDPDYAGYCRVIWNAHVREMTDLNNAGRTHCMRVVLAVEQALRSVLKPHKINLASFGNLTPHVHWHVIPRFADDVHFPNSVWGERRRIQARRAAAPMTSGLRHRLATELLNVL
jgi:diadenosine tetraphosphate (Ap4A) HIT family hydrolase